MSTFERVTADLAIVVTRAKSFIGDFLYQPFGIESSDLVNAVTLYVIVGAAAVALYRAVQPAPRARANGKDYDLGRRA